MSNLLKPLAETLAFNTENVNNCFQDLTDDAANRRLLGGHPCSFKFEVGHLIWSRYNIAGLIGLKEEFKWNDLFGGGKSCNDGEDYPSLEEMKSEWNTISDKIVSRLGSMNDEEAMGDIPNQLPMHEKSVRGGVAFFTWHDSYHVGHVGSVRTALKMTPVKDLFHADEKA